MVSEAGELGLLNDEQVLQAARQILFGPAGVFRGRPEKARRREGERQRLPATARDKLRGMGVKPGVEILYRFRQHARRAEVIRVNRRTVSVGRPGGDEVLRRVRIERVPGVCDE